MPFYPVADDGKTFSGIVGLSLGKSVRVDVAFSRVSPGELKLVLSLRHVDVPAAAPNAVNFNRLSPVYVWDAASRAVTGSGSLQLTGPLQFQQQDGLIMVLSEPVRVTVKVDSLGAIAAMCSVAGSGSEKVESVCHCGSVAPVFLLERGAVPVTAHGLSCLVETVTVSW